MACVSIKIRSADSGRILMWIVRPGESAHAGCHEDGWRAVRMIGSDLIVRAAGQGPAVWVVHDVLSQEMQTWWDKLHLQVVQNDT